VSTVLTAFMAGLALGAYVLGRQIDRRWDPLVVYGVFEIGIGVYALAVPWLFGFLEPLSRWLWSSFSPSFYTFSVLRFLFVSMVLIVPTSLMGGTLPALSRFVTRRPEVIGLSVGSLYGLNTFGAVAGTALTGFALVPVLGVQRTIWLAAALNVVVGVIALALWARSRAGRKVAREAARGGGEPAVPPAVIPGRVRVVLVVFALSGFIAMVYEIAWTRVLSLIIGSSVYAFTIMLPSPRWPSFTCFLTGSPSPSMPLTPATPRTRTSASSSGCSSCWPEW
jgi:spermidine synthase